MKFPSKRDFWLSALIWLTIGLGIFAGLSPFIVEGAGVVGGSLIFMIGFLCSGLMFSLWNRTYYILEEEALYVRMGPFKKRIPYEHITKIKPVRSWLSSMALSAHRVEIYYSKFDLIYISPKEREKFIEELGRRSSHLEVRN